MTEEIFVLVAAEPNGLPTERILAALGATPQELGDAFAELKDSGRLIGLAGWWLTRDVFDEQRVRVREVLEALHTKWPERAYQPVSAVFEAANVHLTGKPAHRWCEAASRVGDLRLGESGIALNEFRPRLTEKQESLLSKIERELLAAGMPSVRAEILGEKLGVPDQAIDNILQVGVQSGRLIEIGPKLVYPPVVLQNVLDLARQEYPAGIAVADLRDMTLTSRRISHALLEYWDRSGVTENFEGVRAWVGTSN